MLGKRFCERLSKSLSKRRGERLGWLLIEWFDGLFEEILGGNYDYRYEDY